MKEGGRSRRQSKKVAGDKDSSATETRTQRVAPGDCARRRIPHQLASRPGKAEQSLVNRTGENDVDCGLYGARMALAGSATGGQARPGAGHTCPKRCIHSISLPSGSLLRCGTGCSSEGIVTQFFAAQRNAPAPLLSPFDWACAALAAGCRATLLPDEGYVPPPKAASCLHPLSRRWRPDTASVIRACSSAHPVRRTDTDISGLVIAHSVYMATPVRIRPA